MENKINIAELLKDCPRGMELDCAMWDNCTFDGIEDVGYINILVKTPTGQIKLSKEGCFVHNCNSAKCVIFPKGKTTWEGFQKPFKDGDIVAYDNELGKVELFIFKEYVRNNAAVCYLFLNGNMELHIVETVYIVKRFATKKEKEKLFQAIKERGYKWNPETKTLDKLIEPKFKVGDKIKHKETNNDVYEISKVYDNSYGLVGFAWMLYMKYQDQYELVPNKFDINTLKPFDKVLVRNTNTEYWRISLFGAIVHDDRQYFMCLANSGFYQCIPYEHNEHLIGTPNDCDDFYKIWEK